MELAATYQDSSILVSLKASVLLWSNLRKAELWLTIPRLLAMSNVPTHPPTLPPTPNKKSQFHLEKKFFGLLMSQSSPPLVAELSRTEPRTPIIS